MALHPMERIIYFVYFIDAIDLFDYLKLSSKRSVGIWDAILQMFGILFYQTKIIRYIFCNTLYGRIIVCYEGWQSVQKLKNVT